jgi:hypothetical protein
VSPFYFTLITSAQDAKQKQEAEFTEVSGRADQLPQAKRNLENAKKEKDETERLYSTFNTKYMPTLNYTNNRIRTMMTVWWPNRGRSWPERFIRGVRNHMNAEQRRYKVVWTNPQILQLPSFGPDPNTIDMGDGDETLTFGPYAMTVRCPNFQGALNHLRSWNSVSGLGVPTVEGVTMVGNSPNLLCSYNVTFTIILKETVPEQDKLIQGGQGGGGGFGGGPAGRFGGGPPMGGSMSMGMGSGGMMSPGGGAPGMSGPMAAGTSNIGGGGGGGSSAARAMAE